MQRGVMQLLQEEIIEAYNSLPDSSCNSPLYSKFKSALGFDDARISIQLDSDELELLLDSLGAPLIEDSPVKKSLRKKVQTFLFFLRNETLVVKQ